MDHSNIMSTRLTTKSEVLDKDNPDIAPGEIIIGKVVSINETGQACVVFTGSDKPINALSTICLTEHHIDRKVALLFTNGNIESPVIMGVIHNPLDDLIDRFNNKEKLLNIKKEHDDVLIEGKKITFESENEIILKCGESSIILMKSGKILIKGKYILNRSTGVNRILGGSVQVN